MLNISRRVNESFWIGDKIKITITRIGIKNVEVGIVAPGMKILREELLNKDGCDSIGNATESDPVGRNGLRD